MTIETQQPFRHAFQRFTWLRDSWDIAELLKDIDAGALAPAEETLDRDFIESYAETVLGLVKEDGTDQKAFSMLMHVDAKDALALPAEALSEPLVLLQVRKGKGILRLEGEASPCHVLGDGNHRLAKAFFEDTPSLRVYKLSAAQSRRYLESEVSRRKCGKLKLQAM